ncbi:MAG: hypothetical protein OK452_01420 [Thaumarchaeota archaeon]|nr:hypothetical protein [Nitrososphaerota archaeon]
MGAASTSPLLEFALESFDLALEQYQKATPKGRRLSVLLCDQAIELVLKEKLRSMGVSIFKQNGRTIDFHEALDTLMRQNGIKIPELSDLELIHDTRNVIQHKGASISGKEAVFYVLKGHDFIKRFVKDELGLNLRRKVPILRRRRRIETGLRKGQGAAAIVPTPQFNLTIPRQSAGLLMEFYQIENLLVTQKFEEAISTHTDSTNLSFDRYLDNPTSLSEEEQTRWKEARTFRNRLAHTDALLSEEEVRRYLENIRVLKNALVKTKSSSR